MDSLTKKKSNIGLYILTAVIFICLYIIHLNNYLLFHIFAEIFSVVIAFSVFIIVWNGRDYLKDDNFLLLYGLAYLFIGFIDLLHTFGYKGMSIFAGYDFYANQFWIAARLMESATLLIGSFLIAAKKRIPVTHILVIYAVITAAFVYSILFSDIFPECFIEGFGQTRFKIVSEYIIILMLAATLFFFIRKRAYFRKDTFLYIILSICFTILSEVAFIIYIDNYGISNMIGHFAKIISFYFIYRAIIKKNILEPHDSIFRDLTEANQLKTRLFSIIAHDLTGPMAGTTSVIRMLDDEYDSLNDPERRMYISETRIAHDNMEILLNNLLEWSRLELSGHEIRKEACIPMYLIRSAVSELQSVADLKDIEISQSCNSDAMIDVDPVSFKVVIRNILSNAIKFSERSGSIQIICDSDSRYFSIRVIDHGTGMVFNREKLKSPVNESKAGTSGEKGTGLGLYIINRYTEENDGILEILSEPGKGTTVILKFPKIPG